MNKKLFKKANTATLITLLTLAISLFAVTASKIPSAHALNTVVKVVPEKLKFGPENVTGQEFIVYVYIENVTDLYGIDIKFAWDPEFLAYLNHTAHIPVEDYPDGILHEPGILIKDDVNATEGTYWLAYSSMAPAPSFDGSGIAFDIAFEIIKQPMALYESDAVITLDITSSDLADSGGFPIAHDVYDGTIMIYAIPFEYPPKPVLKVLPETIIVDSGEQFNASVNIMGEGGVDLDPFWDVAGFDIYMHYNSSIIEALEVTLDPEGTFAGFWPGGIFEIIKTINNTEGWVRVAFLGLPNATDGTHTPPSGNFSVFSVTFNATYTEPIINTTITLKNPMSFVHRMALHADAGLIDLTSPLDTDWTAINSYDFGTPYNMFSWIDSDGDSQLSPGDELLLNNTSSGKWHRYILYDMKGTLALEQQPFQTVDDYIWVADFPNEGLENNGLPGRTTGGGTSAAYNGFGNPYWTGNFTLTYPFVSVNSITVHALPFTADEYTYTLTEGVDYIVYADEDKIELLTPLDVNITNEYWVDGVNNTLNGWPAINYVASGIESVYVKFPNGTERFARNLGFQKEPPSEWWYEPEWPWELEGWWALGYYQGNWTWPDGSEWWINYTAASYITVDYNAEPDPRPYYVEFNGTYQEFLDLDDPLNTTWNEIYPDTLQSYTLVEWTDSDSSGNLTIGDYITFQDGIGNRTYLINGVASDIIVDQVRTVDDKDPESPFYGMPLIIDLAGYSHDERIVSPWYGEESSIPLPHSVEGAQVIPEYPTSFVLVLSLVATAVLIIIAKPKLSKIEK